MAADDESIVPLNCITTYNNNNSHINRSTPPLERNPTLDDNTAAIIMDSSTNNNNNEVIITNMELEDMKTDVKEHLHPASTNGESGCGVNGSLDDGRTNGQTSSVRRKTKSCRRIMKRCMKSRRLHVIIVILVILDSICVSVELIVDLIVTVYHQHHHNNSTFSSLPPPSSTSSSSSQFNSTNSSRTNQTSTNPVLPQPVILSTSSTSSSSSYPSFNHRLNSPYWHQTTSSGFTPTRTMSDEYLWSFISDMNLTSLSVLISIETFFKYFGLIILSLFVLEIMFKIIFIPRDLVRSKWGIFDAIVVFTSFILDVILLKDKKILHTVSGLITLFR